VTALLDTSFLLAMVNLKDRHHFRVLKVAQSIDDMLILPVTVLPEVSYLIGSRLGHHVMRQFLTSLVADKVSLECISRADLKRVTEILEIYADSHLDFVDATIVALAERLGITRILTLDQRDFTIIRPKHHSHFEILPY